MYVVQKSLQRLIEGKRNQGTLLPRSRPHNCSKHMCNPQNESMLVKEGCLQGEPIANYVYLCNFRKRHVCTSASCELYASTHTGTCPISGQNYTGHNTSNYSRNDPRTWRTKNSFQTVGVRNDKDAHLPEMGNRRVLLKRSGANLLQKTVTTTTTTVTTTIIEEPPKKRKKQLYRPAENEEYQSPMLLERAQAIVRTLLFSKYRRIINGNAKRQNMRMRDKHREEYLKQCKTSRQAPVLTDLIRFDCYFSALPLPLAELDQDEDIVVNYSHIIHHVWNVVAKFAENDEDDTDGPKLCFESVALGTLYTMRQGFRYNNVELLPKDPFLLYHLPIINDLTRFGFQKKKITRGEKLISMAYQNAIHLGVSWENLKLDVFRLKDLDEKPQQFQAVRKGKRGVIMLKH